MFIVNLHQTLYFSSFITFFELARYLQDKPKKIFMTFLRKKTKNLSHCISKLICF